MGPPSNSDESSEGFSARGDRSLRGTEMIAKFLSGLQGISFQRFLSWPRFGRTDPPSNHEKEHHLQTLLATSVIVGQSASG